MMNPLNPTVAPDARAFPLRLIAFFLAIAALAVLILARVAPAAAAEPEKGVSDGQLDAALSKAHALVETAPAEFAAALQPVASRFRVLEPATGEGAAAWVPVTLNARGKRLDAVRFRVPDGEQRDFVWAFAAPKAIDRWYILPAEGPAGQGFKTFWKTTARQAFGGPRPADLGVMVQTLPAEHLQPGREYVLWFRFRDEKPCTLWIRSALFPKAPKAYDHPSALKALGLPQPLPEADAPAAK